MNDTNPMKKKILEKAIELILKADLDELIYGNSYVEFGERSITVIDPRNVTVNTTTGKVIYGESPIKTIDKEKNNDK